ncbi:AN1-type zinc finger protein 2B [Frankliniella fusca]|uniref:AN1-type zinc finger protein 2B n=1 Tax=Frankliniella fusca TaxID=407009 RepID=A0AAE1H450_9NEOP|nr:AN1-type zinc finger protein 2B [Frankliniella fusca]
MEFPGLGQHCSEPTCKQLDFLPVKCDACQKIFCHSHMSYLQHACSSAHKRDVQVPVCPLCNKPVPAKRGEQPDIAVGAHIDNNCESDTAQNRRKVFSNRCSAKSCKNKEMIPVHCSECLLNFCLKHRHPVDHQCGGKSAGLRRKAADAALARQSLTPSAMKGKSKTQPPTNQRLDRKTLADVQGNLSEDEALARALAASMQESSQPSNSAAGSPSAQEIADLAYARAIAESEQMHQNSQQAQTAGGSREKCILS